MKDPREHSQAVQRVKVGMIGLAAVILLIGLAGAIMRTASHEAPVTAIGAARPETVANIAHGSATQEVGEPMAEIGVAPMAGNQQASAPAASR